MNNLKELKTTILGLVIWVITGAYFAFPYFSEKELWEVNSVWVASGVIGGLLLMLAPDRMINFLFKKIDKE